MRASFFSLSQAAFLLILPGVLLYTMVVGTLPFFHASPQGLYDLIQRCEYAVPPWLSMECEDVLIACLQPDPASRACVDALRAMPWLQFQDPVPSEGSTEVLDGAAPPVTMSEMPYSSDGLLHRSSSNCGMPTSHGTPGDPMPDATSNSDVPELHSGGTFAGSQKDASCDLPVHNSWLESPGPAMSSEPRDEVLTVLCDAYSLTRGAVVQGIAGGVHSCLYADYTLLLQARMALGRLPPLPLLSRALPATRHTHGRNTSTSSHCSELSASAPMGVARTISSDPTPAELNELAELRLSFTALSASLRNDSACRDNCDSAPLWVSDAPSRILSHIPAPAPPTSHDLTPNLDDVEMTGRGDSGFARSAASRSVGSEPAPPSPLAPRPARRRALTDAATRVLSAPATALQSLWRLFRGRSSQAGPVEPRALRGVFGTGTTSALPPPEVHARLLGVLHTRPAAVTVLEISGFSVRLLSSAIPAKPLKIQAEVGVVAGTKLTGIRFKRLRGEAWAYRQECSDIIELMKL